MKTTLYRVSLEKVIERLASIARGLTSDGLAEHAESIETTIADLGWQCDELQTSDGRSQTG